MQPSCTIAICRTASGYVFRLQGRGTLRESPALRDFICGALQDGAETVLDLSKCEYLDSTFLGCLVMIHQRARQLDGVFAVHADAATRDQLLGAFRLEKILSFAEQLPECLGEPATLQVTDLKRPEFCRHLLETHRRLADLGGPAAETFQGIVEQLQHELDGLSTPASPADRTVKNRR